MNFGPEIARLDFPLIKSIFYMVSNLNSKLTLITIRNISVSGVIFFVLRNFEWRIKRMHIAENFQSVFVSQQNRTSKDETETLVSFSLFCCSILFCYSIQFCLPSELTF